MPNEEMTQQPVAAQAEAMPPMPGAPPMPGGEETQENPLDKIKRSNPLINKVKSQLYGLEKQRARSDEMNTINEKSVDDLREVVLDKFKEFLEENGVDVSDPMSIKAFIEAVGEVNPDMVILLQTIFTSLQKEEGGVDMSVLGKNRNLMESFSKLKKKKSEAEMPMEEAPMEEAMPQM